MLNVCTLQNENIRFHSGPARDAVQAIMSQVGLVQATSRDAAHDYAMGATKVFISKPQTLSLLEQRREKEMPRLIILLQVRFWGCILFSVCV